MMDDSLAILNPWWRDAAAIEADPHLSAIRGKPWYFDNPLKREIPLEGGHAFVLRGPRQVGKTTFIKEMLERTIRSGAIPAHDCFFLTCEALANFRELQKLLTEWLEPRRNRTVLLCLDEITFVDRWQQALLWLFNSGLLGNVLALISGSNARDLLRSSERFSGRHVKEVRLFPLSPSEYATLPCFRGRPDAELTETFLRIGGFPHAIRDFVEHGAVEDETYETYANWIFGDAYRFGLTREILLHILFRIYETLATRVTFQRLIEKSPVKSHETAQAYVEHLESAFLCTVLACYEPEKDMGAPRKPRKMYFIDPLLYGVAGGLLRGIRNTFRWWTESLASDEQRGNLFEAVVAASLSRRHDRLYYWYSAKTGKEVDIVVREGDECSLIEAKSRQQVLPPALGRPVEVVTPETLMEFLRK